VHPQSVRIWDVWLHERAPASPHFPDFLVCLSRRLSAKIGTTSCRWDDDSSGSIHIDPPVGCRSRCRCTSVLSLSLSLEDRFTVSRKTWGGIVLVVGKGKPTRLRRKQQEL
jgi:hypothetical protein